MLIVTLAIDVEEGDVANWTAMAAGRDFCMSEKAVHQIGSLVAHAAAVAADETKTANEASSRDPGFDRDAGSESRSESVLEVAVRHSEKRPRQVKERRKTIRAPPSAKDRISDSLPERLK